MLRLIALLWPLIIQGCPGDPPDKPTTPAPKPSRRWGPDRRAVTEHRTQALCRHRRILKNRKGKYARELKRKGPREFWFGDFGCNEVAWRFRVTRIGRLRPYTIRQIMGDDAALAERHDTWFIVRGVDFSGLVDGMHASTPSMMQVTGTETYPTPIGSTNTVFVLEPFDITPFLPLYGLDARHCAYLAHLDKPLYHRPGCSFVKRIEIEDLMGFTMQVDAEFYNKKPCRRCKPSGKG